MFVYAFLLSNFGDQAAGSAVIEYHTFCMYGFKDDVNEPKTPGLKCLLMQGSMSNSGHVKQQLVS